MITAFFIWLLGSVVKLVASLVALVPVPDPQPVVNSVGSGVASVFASAGALAYWVPFASAGAATLVVGAMALAAGSIKLVRIVASFLTLGGGSAA